jgi:tubulin-specific chaperone B
LLISQTNPIQVVDSRPAHLQTNYTTPTPNVPKYEMPPSQYATLSDSVLAWKKSHKLGRFDPSQKSADELTTERHEKDKAIVSQRGIEVGKRARVSKDDGRRGEVQFVGTVEGLGGKREAGCVWVGVELDEPVGRNDGGVEVEVGEGEGEERQVRKEKRRLWQGRGEKYGVLVRPEKVEVGEEWTVVDDLMDEDMEEI